MHLESFKITIHSIFPQFKRQRILHSLPDVCRNEKQEKDRRKAEA